jgi:hypothetical protein
VDRKQREESEEGIHLRFLGIPDQIGGEADQKSGQEGNPALQPPKPYLIDEGHQKHPPKEGKEPDAKLAPSDKAYPEREKQIIEGAVLARCYEPREKFHRPLLSEEDGIYLIPPKALEIEVVEANSESERDQKKEEKGKFYLLHLPMARNITKPKKATKPRTPKVRQV